MVARPKTFRPDVTVRSKALGSGDYDFHNFRESGKNNDFVGDQNTHVKVLNDLKTSN